MTSTTHITGSGSSLDVGGPSLAARKTTMRTTARCASVIAALLIGAAGFAVSSPAWAKPLPKPTIVLNNSGSPFVSGSNFTPDGSVVLTEWAVGTKKPISTESETVESNGAIFFYLNCDGQQQVTFRAKDVSSHKKSNKTAPAELICIN